MRIDGDVASTGRRTVRQDGDDDDSHRFSCLRLRRVVASGSFHVIINFANTSAATHDILRRGLPDSPLYNGQIQSIGPRYCYISEAKIVTFAEKTEHQLFMEPESEDGNEYYLNRLLFIFAHGDIQLEALKTIPALLPTYRIYRPGYAIEYDFFDPTQLSHTLESRVVDLTIPRRAGQRHYRI